MVKKNQVFLNWINVLSDAALVFISYFIAVFFRFRVFDGVVSERMTDRIYIYIVAVFSLGIVFTYYVAHVYRHQRMKKLGGAATKIVCINGIGTLCMVAVLYMIKVMNFSRVALFGFWIISSVLVVFKHAVLRLILHYYRKQGYNLRHVAIVGNGKSALQYKKDIKKNPQYGYRIAGYFSKVENPKLGKCLGAYEDIADYLEANPLDELVVALEPHEVEHMKHVLMAADKEGVKVTLIPFFNDYYPAHPTIETIGKTKMVNLRATPLDNIGWAMIKRAMDIVGSAILIIICAIPMIIIAIGVKISSPGPIFFSQERVGLGKKPFKMLKFRSMRTDVDHNGWSTDKDNRKTKFGSFIRKFSLDELPQLFNVFVGQMSLIGPRPELPFYVAQFKEEVPLYLVRQQIRPGMTGWAQVNGLRGDTSIEERVEYDIWYIENWSLGLDIKILWKTAFGGMINSEQL